MKRKTAVKETKRHSMTAFGTVSGLNREIRVNRLEKRLDPQVAFPHRHDFFHLVVITSGSGWHEIDFQRHSVKSGQVFFMKPGQVHAWKLAPHTKGFVIEFAVDAFTGGNQDALSAQLLHELPDALSLGKASAELRREIQFLLSTLLHQYEGKAPAFEAMLRVLLQALLIGLYQTGFRERKTPLDPFREKFLALVEEAFSREHEVAFYAKQMKLSPKALTMRVSRALGRSARTVVLERCFLEAKRLLAYSSANISEVGNQLGFSDANYFARFFKERAGRSPGAFRRSAQSLSNGK